MEVYTADLIMADAPTPAHRAFLWGLSDLLALPADFVRRIHDELPMNDTFPVMVDRRVIEQAVSPQA